MGFVRIVQRLFSGAHDGPQLTLVPKLEDEPLQELIRQLSHCPDQYVAFQLITARRFQLTDTTRLGISIMHVAAQEWPFFEWLAQSLSELPQHQIVYAVAGHNLAIMTSLKSSNDIPETISGQNGMKLEHYAAACEYAHAILDVVIGWSDVFGRPFNHNAKDDFGRTPIQYAILNSNLNNAFQMLDFLSSRETETLLKRKDKRGHCPLDLIVCYELDHPFCGYLQRKNLGDLIDEISILARKKRDIDISAKSNPEQPSPCAQLSVDFHALCKSVEMGNMLLIKQQIQAHGIDNMLRATVGLCDEKRRCLFECIYAFALERKVCGVLRTDHFEFHTDFVFPEALFVDLQHLELTTVGLGKGGFGSIVKGKILSGFVGVSSFDHSLTIAVKTMSNPDVDQDKKTRLALTEFCCLYAMRNCPFVLDTYGVVRDEDGEFKLLLQYCKTSLRDLLLDSNVKLDMSTKLQYALQIVGAVMQCHHANIVHRDLSCNNILIDHRNEIKICDFGASRGIESYELTHQTYRVGHGIYTPPECYLSDSVNLYAAEVYSIARVLEALFIGKPHPDEGSRAPLRSCIRKNIPHSLRQLLLSAVHHNPEKRPNINEIYVVLEAYLHTAERLRREHQITTLLQACLDSEEPSIHVLSYLYHIIDEASRNELISSSLKYQNIMHDIQICCEVSSFFDQELTMDDIISAEPEELTELIETDTYWHMYRSKLKLASDDRPRPYAIKVPIPSQEKGVIEDYLFHKYLKSNTSPLRRHMLDVYGLIKITDPISNKRLFGMVMELPRCSLSSHLLEEEGLSNSQLLRLCLQMLNAVNFLHGQSVTHLRLNLASFQMSMEDIIKLDTINAILNNDQPEAPESSHSDYGIYSPPELHTVNRCSTAGDVYSFGVCILAIFNKGKAPARESPDDIRLGRFGTLLSSDLIPFDSLRHLVDRMVGRDPDSRPTFSEIYDVITSLLASRSI